MNTKIQNTKKALRTAALALVEEHSIRDITVSELCKKAGINRTTFYKYYSVPSDVIAEYLADVQDQVFSTVKTSRTDGAAGLYDIFLEICRAYYTDPLFTKLYTYSQHNNLSYIEKQIDSGVISYDRNYTYFIAGGVDSVLSRWIVEGFIETPEEIAQKLDTMIRKIIMK